MISRWLSSCISHHRQCNRKMKYTTVPTRLLDIGGLNTGILKLVENAANEPYVALSHRWGSEGLPRTTLANLHHHKELVSVEKLSRTLCEAIHIVSQLGLRYIWIDALCIIQDSNEDWLAEASKMGDVFSGAVFTLAVADSENHSEGIFRKHEVHCLRPFYVDRLRNMPHRDRGWYDGEGEVYVFPGTPKVNQGVRPKGPLDSRGWVLQEQLLSPRVLYYGRGEIFWDCLTLSASESSPLGASLLTDTNPEETWAMKLLRKSIAGAIPPETLGRRTADVWKQVIKNYSARKLTKSSDRMIAMEGIVDATAILLQSNPVAGMWKTDLWDQLLWWLERPSDQGRTETSEQRFMAPTWSWLNAGGPIFYHSTLHVKNTSRSHDFTELR
ncbi:HET-domain-containing protein, partial [Lentithecium fluviatile CBS 122367]